MPASPQRADLLKQVAALGLPPNRSYVPMALWGKDHWSTFAYLECRVVDDGGTIDKSRMRCDSDRHPKLSWRLPFSGDIPRSGYPTRLRGGIELFQHDDWDCTDDLCVAGLITKHGTAEAPSVKLTEKGAAVAAALRRHKGNGGTFGTFSYED